MPPSVANGLEGVQAVIFDMDGVLTDSEPLHFAATRRVLARYGVEYTETDNREFLGVTSLETYGRLCTRHRLAVSAAQLARSYREELLRTIPDEARPMAGVPRVLERLRVTGFRLALASSADRDVIETTLGCLGVTDVFEVILSGAEVERGKPAPDIFVECAQRLRLPPEACLVIEDSRNGVLAARGAGMRCIAIPCPTTQHQDFSLATRRLADLTALPLLLEPRAQ